MLLPPYQFEKSRHWLELKKPQKAEIDPSIQIENQEEPPNTVWTFLGYQDNKQRSARFRINTMSSKYKELVSGHVIVQTAPICPATLELDIAIEALMSLRTGSSSSSLHPQVLSVENQSPLCIDSSRSVWLDAEATDSDHHVWSWKIASSDSKHDSAVKLHVTGTIVFHSTEDPNVQLEFARFERLVKHQHCRYILNSNDADDIIQGRNIYKTFAEIVDYGESYRGVQRIVGLGDESAGRVVKRHRGETWLDTHLCDCFSQVGGIWVNCMTNRAPTDMCIASVFEQLTRSPKVRKESSRPDVWDVLARHHRVSENAFLTDLFVFDSTNGALMEFVLGIKYSKVPKLSMSRLLSRLVDGGVKKAQSPAELSINADVKLAQNTVAHPPISTPFEPAAAFTTITGKAALQVDILRKLRNILADLSGLEPDDIKDEAELADLGIDSLMGMELAREISDVFKCSFPVVQLIEVVDFKSLVHSVWSLLDAANDGVTTEDEDSNSESNHTRPESLTSASSESKFDVTEYLADFLGLAEATMAPATRLVDLGVDMPLFTNLRLDLVKRFNINVSEEAPFEETTIEQISLEISSKIAEERSTNPDLDARLVTSVLQPNDVPLASSNIMEPSAQGGLKIPAVKIHEAFREANMLTDKYIIDYNGANYVKAVVPKQN